MNGRCSGLVLINYMSYFQRMAAAATHIKELIQVYVRDLDSVHLETVSHVVY